MPTPHRPLLVTHSGAFHLDDAFAYAVLRLALGHGEAGHDHTLMRTRDAAVIAGADVVWDVGAVCDPAAGRFDHHQRGAPVRENGLPYSAAGLVWRHHGEAAVRALLAFPEAGDLAPAVAAEIDREVDTAVQTLYNNVPVAPALVAQARGILIFPKIVKGGFLVGGEYGEGALRLGGQTVGYYNIAAASYGLQAGLQAFGYALVFMTDAALLVRASPGEP